MKFSFSPPLFYLLIFIFNSANSQQPFQVYGKIDNIRDGATLRLFRYRDGSIDEASRDSIRQGRFQLTDTVSEPTLYWILGDEKDFPHTHLDIWAEPGLPIHVNGSGNKFRTWKVTSSSRWQQEENKYLASSISDWDKIQETDLKIQELRLKSQAATGASKDSLDKRKKLLSDQIESIEENIDRTQIKLLQKLPVTKIWLNKMWGLSFKLSLNPQLSYREPVLQLYKRMTDSERTSSLGEKITGNLFPPVTVKIGDPMLDMPLLDKNRKVHSLAEYQRKGRYLLLDFGFVNCGSCIEALPETKSLQDSLADKFAIIAINVDATDYWRSKTEKDSMPFISLNDRRGRSGLANGYGVKGYPYYVMISPDGIVLGEWMGYYRKGDLTTNVLRYIAPL